MLLWSTTLTPDEMATEWNSRHVALLTMFCILIVFFLIFLFIVCVCCEVVVDAKKTKKAEERGELQRRVLALQMDCEAELEQKREIYDETQALQKRIESLDAQISMLSEWRKR